MENQATTTPQQTELSQKKENQLKTMAEMEVVLQNEVAMETLSFINNPQDAVIELRLQGESVGERVHYVFSVKDVGNIVEQLLHVMQVASLEVYQETGKVPFDYYIENIF